MGNEEPSGQQAGEPALVCGCGWEGSYADLNETAEGMTCPKCRLSRNMDCAATPPAPSASFRDRLEELAQDWSSRKYNYPSDRVSDEEYARNEGKEDAYQDAAIDLCRLLKEPETSPPWQEQAARQCEEWALLLSAKGSNAAKVFDRIQFNADAVKLRDHARAFRALLSKPAKGEG